jgi:hypothetical protein
MNLFDIYSRDGHELFLARYPNESGPCEIWMAKGEEELRAFLSKNDKPGYGVYVALAHLKNGWRNKENVLTLQWLFAEVDFKDHPSLTPEEIYQRLISMPMKPSMIVFSGHGYHTYWLLSEPVDASPGDGQTRLEDALKLACSYVGGDPHIAEASRVLRLPGSHNSRNPGESILVEIRLQELERTYELSDLVDFWLEAQPIMPPPVKKEKEGPADPVNGKKYDGPFDADADLTAMRFRGSPSIHYTQLRVAAKLCSEGKLVDDLVSSIISATQKAVEGDPAAQGWNWGEEEVAVRKMCHDWINKRMLEDGEDLSHCLNDKLYKEWASIRDNGKRPYVSRNRFGVYILGKEWFEKPKKEEQPSEKASEEEKPAPKGRIRLQPYSLPAFDQIPRRAWLYGNHYMRRIVSATVGPGGIGKSSLGLVEAISMALGVDILGGGEAIAPLRVWYHNGEDPKEELDRRIAAICIHYELDEGELRKQMFVTCGLDMPIKVGRGAQEVKIDKALVAEIIYTIQEHGIDVAIFDPLVTMHNTSEIFTATMDPIIREAFALIANETNISVELAHHTRKKATGQEEFTTADARGSSGIVDAVRAMRVTNQMSKEEANGFGLNELDRFQYFRVTKGKANMTRQGRGDWFKFQSVILPNGDEEQGIPGDDVGVLTAWEPPDLSITLTDDIRSFARNLVLANANLMESEHGANWIGKPLAVHMNLDPRDKLDRARLKTVIRQLIAERVLKTERRGNAKGRAVNFVCPGQYNQ